jgi:TolA-binding protein
MMEMYLGRNIDGVAHWAHIGGFLCGVAYAFLIGLTGEGKTEFLTEDARASLEKNHGTTALEHAQQLLKHKPGDPTALRLIAEALDTKGPGLGTDGVAHAEKALDAWEVAIHAFVNKGDRDGAASAYNQAIIKHNGFIMPPHIQFDLGSHMARIGDNIGAAQTLVKIPFTYPDAPEGELALLRGAQLYAQHLHDATMANYLLTTLLQRYPTSQWRAQAEAGLKTTQQKMDEERTSQSQDASKQVLPVHVPVAQMPMKGAKK